MSSGRSAPGVRPAAYRTSAIIARQSILAGVPGEIHAEETVWFAAGRLCYCAATMRPRDLDALDFAAVCRRTADFAASRLGLESCMALHPLALRGDAELALDQATDMLRLVTRHGPPPLSAFPDIREHLRLAAIDGFTLTGEALVEVRAVIDCLQRCAAYFRRHAGELGTLAELTGDLPRFEPLAAALARSLDDDGSVLDQASPELAAMRASIRRLRDTLSRRLNDVLARRGMADVVADQYVTLRNDRFVIPVKASAGRRVDGVVQDRSVSGETLFVEPLFAVELNNQLLNAVRDEQAIVHRILGELTGLVRSQANALTAAIDQLAAVDCAAARAAFAAEYDCVRPSFSDGEIQLRAARHPVLAFTGRPVTPIDILLPAERSVLVVTGPNTGGKTVALKTLGLAALMARSGLLVPAAAGARVPFFSAVFTDVGDEQNIERNLSTFSAHVANLREVLTAADDTCLVLLDEPGVGTDPEEGAALAVGLLEHIERRAVRAAVTTHYRAVKLHALRSPHCQVCAVDFDAERMLPRYNLVYESLGRSLALPIAEQLGLPHDILDAARRAQSEDTRSFNDALARLETARQDLDALRADCARQTRSLEEQRSALREREVAAERLAADLRERRQRAWKDELREAREFVRTLKDKSRLQLRRLRDSPQARGEFARFVRDQEAQIAAHAEPGAAAAAPPTETAHVALHAGDRVIVGARGIRGELLSIEGERAWVQCGSARMQVPAAELHRLGGRRRQPDVRLVQPVGDGEREVLLVGLRARQALEKLEGFLDRAVQSDQSTVRIVHGVGSGALQRAVREYLSTSPYCATFRAGEEGEGGAGVTVATLAG